MPTQQFGLVTIFMLTHPSVSGSLDYPSLLADACEAVRLAVRTQFLLLDIPVVARTHPDFDIFTPTSVQPGSVKGNNPARAMRLMSEARMTYHGLRK